MAVLVRSCCCCGCSLRTGVLVIAVLTLIEAGCEIYLSFSSASELYRGRYKDLPPSAERSQVLINSQKANGAFGIFQVLTSLSLIAACILKNRFLAKPYLVLQVIFVGYCLFVIIYFSVVWGVVDAFSVLIPYGIVFSLSIYFLIMVYSFHEALREDPSGVTAGFVPNYPSGSAPMATTV